MSNRVRSPRERKMAVSHSEPNSLRQSHRIPSILPIIKNRKPIFYDEIILSPDFVDITAHHKGISARPPQSCNLSSSRSRLFFQPSSPNKDLLVRLAEEDRVVQRYEQEQEQYRDLVHRIKEKSLDRQRRRQRNNLSIIYERLMGII